MSFSVLTLLLATQIFLPWTAQSGPEIEPVAALGGYRFDIAKGEDTAYLAAGTGIHAIDISDVEAPTLAWVTPPESTLVTSIAYDSTRGILAGVRSDVLFCLEPSADLLDADERLEVYRTSDGDQSPAELIATLPLPADWCHSSLAFVGDWLVMIARSPAEARAIRIVDLSDPLQPQQLPDAALDPSTPLRDLAAEGRHLYAALHDHRSLSRSNHGFLVLERTGGESTDLVVRSLTPWPDPVVSLDVGEGMLAQAARVPLRNPNRDNAGFLLWDVSRPEAPNLLSSLPIADANTVSLGDGIATIGGDGGLTWIDVGRPKEPAVLMEEVGAIGGMHSTVSTAIGRRVVLAGREGLTAAEISTSGGVTGGELALPHFPTQLWMSGDRAVSLSTLGGVRALQLLDVTDIHRPVPMGFIGPVGLTAVHAPPTSAPNRTFASGAVVTMGTGGPGSRTLWLGIWGPELKVIDLAKVGATPLNSLYLEEEGVLHVSPPRAGGEKRIVTVATRNRVRLIELNSDGQLTLLSEVWNPMTEPLLAVVRTPGHVLVVDAHGIIGLRTEGDRLIEASRFGVHLSQNIIYHVAWIAGYLYVSDIGLVTQVFELDAAGGVRLVASWDHIWLASTASSGPHVYWTGHDGAAVFTSQGYIGVLAQERTGPRQLTPLHTEPFPLAGLGGDGDRLVTAGTVGGVRLFRVTRE